MRALIPAIVVAACVARLLAQAPAQAPATKATAAQRMSSTRLGFNYSLPADWTVDDMQETAAQVQQQAASSAQNDAEMRAVGCMESPFRAHHGKGGSTVAIVALPFDCFGQSYTNADLPAFATSIAEGLKKGWKIADPKFGTYTLGAHGMWIERATGSLLNQPDGKKTLELVCSMLKNGAVCWMGFVADDADLKAFEQGGITLDGEASPALVPATAFDKKP
jgi:hypothetical protein